MKLRYFWAAMAATTTFLLLWLMVGDLIT